MEFTIGITGNVSAAAITEDTLEDEAVAACIQRVTEQLRFPQPRGGGTVNVTWPLVFASAD